jgi:hypothetical protein
MIFLKLSIMRVNGLSQDTCCFGYKKVNRVSVNRGHLDVRG